MRRQLTALALAVAVTASVAAAQAGEDQDDIVRLPGQGLVKADAEGVAGMGKRDHLVPGGGLMVSFDKDRNGRITELELLNGVEAAFLLADTNQDGTLSALEQIAWADSLPTHDDTLSNPARFDPNLDRMVSYDEFTNVIASLAADYAEETGEILVSALKAPKPRRDRRDNNPLLDPERLQRN